MSAKKIYSMHVLEGSPWAAFFVRGLFPDFKLLIFGPIAQKKWVKKLIYHRATENTEKYSISTI